MADTVDPVPPPADRTPVNPAEAVRALAMAQLERQLAEFATLDRLAELPPRRRRRTEDSTTVFTLRLDRREFEALERRAAAAELKPSVLARNLIRGGLSATHGSDAFTAALDRLESAVDDLRALSS